MFKLHNLHSILISTLYVIMLMLVTQSIDYSLVMESYIHYTNHML